MISKLYSMLCFIWYRQHAKCSPFTALRLRLHEKRTINTTNTKHSTTPTTDKMHIIRAFVAQRLRTAHFKHCFSAFSFFSREPTDNLIDRPKPALTHVLYVVQSQSKVKSKVMLYYSALLSLA